ncbi:protein-disulfide reductase, partial [Proteus mirabilis]|nr:protein-disulfide reductase [Proteus mirabilis]
QSLTDDGYSRQVNDTLGQGDSVSLPTAESGVGLWSILAFAMLGGLILNLMPCGLPVLAMKLGSMIQIEKRDTGAIR